MENNLEQYKKDLAEFSKIIEEKMRQAEIDYPEYPEEKKRGLDGGNPMLREKVMEINKWAHLEIKKIAAKYGVE